jgi:hypothetical protein
VRCGQAGDDQGAWVRGWARLVGLKGVIGESGREGLDIAGAAIWTATCCPTYTLPHMPRSHLLSSTTTQPPRQHPEVARLLQGRMYDVVCKFDAAPEQ